LKRHLEKGIERCPERRSEKIPWKRFGRTEIKKRLEPSTLSPCDLYHLPIPTYLAGFLWIEALADFSSGQGLIKSNLKSFSNV
jgi:hypothetical protein